MSDSGDLSDREILLLRSISRATGLGSLAKLTGVSPGTIGREIAMLQMKGYIADDGGLTQKGLDAAKREV